MGVMQDDRLTAAVEAAWAYYGCQSWCILGIDIISAS